MRRLHKVVLGDNDNRDMAKAIRGHANAVETIPMSLILMGLSELAGAWTSWLALLACGLIIGRGLHARYFTAPGTHFKFRYYGMLTTVIVQVNLLLTLGLTLIL